MEQDGRLLKFTLLVKRKEGMSEDEFHKYWTEKHPEIVNKWLAGHGVIRYIQVCVKKTDKCIWAC